MPEALWKAYIDFEISQVDRGEGKGLGEEGGQKVG